jgi:hypothetical protein
VPDRACLLRRQFALSFENAAVAKFRGLRPVPQARSPRNVSALGNGTLEEFMRHCVPAFCFCFFSSFATAQLHAAPDSVAAKPNSDWPCRQILVDHMSSAAVWSGPSIEGINSNWDSDIAALATKLAARRLPLEAAKSEIDNFARDAGTEKQRKLTALFAALFEKLDGERAQIIAGLERFGHAQKAMANRIRAENENLRSAQNTPVPEAPKQEGAGAGPNVQADSGGAAGPGATPLERLQWDLRVFDDRRRSLSYVCDVPVSIEQRLFSLAREIQAQLD